MKRIVAVSAIAPSQIAIDPRMRNLGVSLNPNTPFGRLHRYTFFTEMARTVAQVTYYRGKLKGFIVLGGIALALMPCFQQSHALCRLVGYLNTYNRAANDTVALEGMDWALEALNCGQCCGAGSNSQHESLPLRGGDSPCGPDCYCTQASDPREAPRQGTEPGKSFSSTVELNALTTLAFVSQTDCDRLSALPSDALPSYFAGETCVRLCRFLI